MVELPPQARGGLFPDHHPYDQHEVHPPCAVVALTAVRAEPGLTPLPVRSVVRRHKVSEFMQARLFALSDAVPVIRADLHPALAGVGEADSPSAHHRDVVVVRGERGLERRHLLNGGDVAGAVLDPDDTVLRDQQGGREWTGR